jgi:SMI1/KNR4 family protein SUKH-1
MQTIAQRLDTLPDLLAALKEAASRYLKYPSVLGKDGVMDIGHRPWVAELNYMLMVYPGIDADSLSRYCRRFEIQVPEIYADFLRSVNGGFFFGMSLCGVPHSMLGNPPLLDRRILQCHDLATAATQWIDEYRVPSGFFHFGGRYFSYRENLAYFFDGQNRIVSVRGKKKIIGEWSSFADFLSEELKESEKLEEQRRPAKWED